MQKILCKEYVANTRSVFVTKDEAMRLCSTIGLEYHDGLEKRILQHTITDATQDHSGDVVIPDGVDFSDFFPKNPVVMGFHDYHNMPIGSCVKIWLDKRFGKLNAWTLFYDNIIDPTGKSDAMYKMYSSGAIKGVSIGFHGIDVIYPKNEKEREELGVGEHGRYIKSCKLVEYSLVPIPCNPNALTMYEAIGVDIKSILVGDTVDFVEDIESKINSYIHSKNIGTMDDEESMAINELVSKLVLEIDSLKKIVEALTIEFKNFNDASSKEEQELKNAEIEKKKKDAIEAIKKIFNCKG